MTVAHLWYNEEILTANTSENVTDNCGVNRDCPVFSALANIAGLCNRADIKPGQVTEILIPEYK